MDRRTFVGSLAAAGAPGPILHRAAGCTARAENPERGAGPWAVRRRFMLVRRHRAASGGGDQCHVRAKSADNAASERGGDAARPGAAGRSDRAGWAFLRRHDCHRSRRQSKGDFAGLCRSAGSRCGRGLRGTGEAIPDTAGLRGHRLVRRVRATQRGGFPARFRRRPAGGEGARALRRSGVRSNVHY